MVRAASKIEQNPQKFEKMFYSFTFTKAVWSQITCKKPISEIRP